MNSTLGSFVPLAMFYLLILNLLYYQKSSYIYQYIHALKFAFKLHSGFKVVGSESGWKWMCGEKRGLRGSNKIYVRTSTICIWYIYQRYNDIYLKFIVDVFLFTTNFASNLSNGMHDFYNCKMFASSIEDDILGDIRTKIEAKIRNCEDMIEVPSTSHQHKNSQIVQERSAW